jgi:biopolymer transport protein ExbD
MTPMIDVVFLLLIFFVCASVGKISEALLPTDLAAGSVESEVPIERLEQPFGDVWLFLSRENGQTATQVNQGGEVYEDVSRLEMTLVTLAELSSELPVILDIEPDVPLGDMIQVYDACRAAGFESVHFATGDK